LHGIKKGNVCLCAGQWAVGLPFLARTKRVKKPASPDRHSASAVNPRQPVQRVGLPPLLTIYNLVEPVSALR
jgi:hypothetical protein